MLSLEGGDLSECRRDVEGCREAGEEKGSLTGMGFFCDGEILELGPLPEFRVKVLDDVRLFRHGTKYFVALNGGVARIGYFLEFRFNFSSNYDGGGGDGDFLEIGTGTYVVGR